MEPIVRILNLSHHYSSAWAIKDINFEITRTGIYGLLGSNGAGKSTTMNILCGVLNQTQGDAFINGINTRTNPIEAKRQIGFLPQVPPLYTDLTVREYLVYCARLRDMPEVSIPKAVEEVMVKCSISHMKDRLLKNLSGGYRQRTGIAQAIIHKPKVVVLDEPTNGLDPVQIVEVRNLIREIAQAHTVIFSSHILSEVQALCQQIIMIEQGKLVFSDSMETFNNYVAPKSILVEMENPPSTEMLSKMPGVNRVEKVSSNSFRVYSEEGKALSEHLINVSVKGDWRLTQLVIEKHSIDEVFKQLAKTASQN